MHSHRYGAIVSLMCENPESDLLLKPPRNPKTEPLVDWKLFVHAYFFIGLPETIGSHLMFFVYLQRTWGVHYSYLLFSFENWGKTNRVCI